MIAPASGAPADGERRAQGPWAKARPVVAAVLVAIALALLSRGQLLWTTERHLERGLPWIAVGVFVVMAARRICPTRRRPEPAAWSRLDTGVLVLLTIAAAAVRFPFLATLPPGGFYDEAQNGIVGRQILAGDRPIFVSGATQMPAFFFYLVAAALKVGGDDLVSVRGLAALLGTLTVPVFYAFARRLSPRAIAAAAALLLAGSRWHLTFSRVAFTGIFNPLLSLLAAFLLLRGIEGGRKADFAALGLVVGLGLQTYYAFNLFPLVLAAILTVRLLARRLPRPGIPVLARGLLLSACTAAVVLAPLVLFAVREPGTFLQRANVVAIWNPDHGMVVGEALRTNVRRHLGMFNLEGDQNARHNVPEEPQLGPAAGVLFLLGLGAALARPLRWPGAAWLAWWAVMLLPGILTIEAPQAYRTIGILPGLYLIVAQGFELMNDIVGSRQQRRAPWRRAVLQAAMIAAAAVAAAQDVRRYFVEQAKGAAAWDAHESDHTVAARFVARHVPRYSVWVSPLHGDHPVFRFWLPRHEYRSFVASDHFPLDADSLDPRREGALYVLQPFEAELYRLFLAFYPHATMERHHDPFGRVSFVSVAVPREDVERPKAPRLANGGLTGAFYANRTWDGPPSLVRRDPSVLFHFHSEPMPDPFTVDWSAWLRVETPGEHEFEMTASGPALLLVGGTPVVSQADFPPAHRPQRAQLHLAAGEHLLVVRYLESSFLSTIRLSWRPPGAEWAAIPVDLLRPVPAAQYLQFRDGLPRP